jgi:hypothetical protein
MDAAAGIIQRGGRMRLIDADELIIMQLHDENDTPIGPRFVPAELIEDAPTIEAIPLEWIEKQKAECYPRSLAWIALEALLRTWKEEKDEAEEKNVRNDG